MSKPRQIHSRSRKAQRQFLAEYCGCICAYCGARRPLEELTLDHKTSRKNGGRPIMINLCLACAPCNELKADSDVEEFRRRMECRFLVKVKFAGDNGVLDASKQSALLEAYMIYLAKRKSQLLEGSYYE